MVEGRLRLGLLAANLTAIFKAMADRLLALAGIAIEGISERKLDKMLNDLESRSAQLAALPFAAVAETTRGSSIRSRRWSRI